MEIEFNEFSRNNNLDIKVNVELLEFEKPTDSYENLKSIIVSLFQKKKKTYDIYYYDSNYSFIFGPYLLNLKDHLEKEYIEMYDPKILKETGTYKDAVIGLPISISYGILYSNKAILPKHGKSIPKTWDELINTCKDIMAEENNPDLICYNGLYDNSEQGLYDLYQFIYSCRDSYNSTYPTPEDESFIESLNMLKKLKTEVASDEIFQSNENLTFERLMNGNAIFINYWYIMEPLLSRLPYNISVLPGLKEGISGSMIKGINIGIKKNISKEKLDASLQIYKYIVSKESQKKTFELGTSLTGITELLEDEELCKKAPCDLIKSTQFTGEPKYITDGPDDYSRKFKNSIYQFLYENKSIENTLKQINDITKSYTISLSTEYSSIGLIAFIVLSAITVLMLASLSFIYSKSISRFYYFLPNKFWILTVFGSIIFLWVPITNYGPFKPVKCFLRILLMSIGFTLSVCPTFYKLIFQFPEENNITLWVVKNKYTFMLLNILIDLIFCSTSLLSSYNSKIVMNEEGERFEKCQYGSLISIILLFVYKFLIVIVMLFLIFVEWNNPDTLYDVKFTICALYIDILTAISIIIFNILELKNYETFFEVNLINSLLFSVSNYLLLYGSRLILKFIISDEPSDAEIIRKAKANVGNNDGSKTACNSSITSNGKRSSTNGESEVSSREKRTSSDQPANFVSRMIDHHYSKNGRGSFLDSSISSGNSRN